MSQLTEKVEFNIILKRRDKLREKKISKENKPKIDF